MPVRGDHAPGSTNQPRQLSNLVGGLMSPPYSGGNVGNGLRAVPR